MSNEKNIRTSLEGGDFKTRKTFWRGVGFTSCTVLDWTAGIGVGLSKTQKDQKVDVMHIAVCALLSQWGYYEFTGYDEGGWPHWKETNKLPSLNAKQQDKLIREAIVEYFT